MSVGSMMYGDCFLIGALMTRSETRKPDVWGLRATKVLQSTKVPM